MVRAITVHVQWLHYISITLCIQCTELYVYELYVHRMVRTELYVYRNVRIQLKIYVK